MARLIIIHGPDGAGKSTQARELASRHGWRYISTGDLCRASDDPVVKESLSRGELIASEKLEQMLEAALAESLPDQVVVLDGTPRKIGELDWLNGLVDAGKHSIQQVVAINVPEEVSRLRLLQRGRSSDTPEAIDRRMGWFQGDTAPVIAALKAKGLVKEVDGTASPEEVSRQIEEIVCVHN